MTKLPVACLQMRSSTNVHENIQTCVQYVREAARAGAQLVVTPEMTTLLDMRPGKLSAQARTQEEDTAVPVFGALARTLGIELVIGSIPIKVAADRCVGRCFLFARTGALIATYDKIHLFDAQPGAGQSYRESANFRAGSQACVVQMPHYAMGLTICYDLRFPQLYRSLAQGGAEIITVPSSFTAVTGEAHWHTLLRARAIETGCFVLAPAQHGLHADGRQTYGHSLIVDPWGQILAERAEEPGILLAQLDLSLVAQARQRVPSLQHDRAYTVKRIASPQGPGNAQPLSRPPQGM